LSRRVVSDPGFDLLSVRQERFVADCEERSAQSGENPELVVGPFDGDERVAQRDHLLAVMKRAPTIATMRMSDHAASALRITAQARRMRRQLRPARWTPHARVERAASRATLDSHRHAQPH
jgi:hypothetical protein